MSLDLEKQRAYYNQIKQKLDISTINKWLNLSKFKDRFEIEFSASKFFAENLVYKNRIVNEKFSKSLAKKILICLVSVADFKQMFKRKNQQ